MDIEIIDKRITLANVYGPSTGDNPDFFEKVFNLVNQIDNETVVIGGDWNCFLNPTIDSRNYASNPSRPRTRAKILNCMSDFNLVDVFRNLYPDKRTYSWRKFKSIKQSRLDYFLISEDLLGEIRSSTISSGYRSDHSLVTVTLKKKEFKRDRTFWKFNNSLLKDKEYLMTIKNVIETTKKQYANIVYSPDKINTIGADEIQFTVSDQLFFETLLMEIRGKTISYASYKKKKEIEEEKSLKDRLTNLETDTAISQEVVEEIDTIKNKLEQLRNKKIEGITVRSRVNWIHEGEKPTRYFCNLENRNFVNKTVSFLEKPTGEILEDQTEILREVEHFYSSLYCEKTTDDVEISDLIVDAPKIKDNEIAILKENIKFTELAVALKNMKNNKSPGPDGFTVEMFNFFSMTLVAIMFVLVTKAFQMVHFR